MGNGIGGHHSAHMASDDWITPREIIAALGPFDLDPCASATQPWPTAEHMLTVKDNGLLHIWSGRVWLNPPYGLEAAQWLQRLADHGNGIALIFARVETDMFFRWVWERACGLLFIRGRLYFHRPDGTRAPYNSGGPSVLIAYGHQNVERLAVCGIGGQLVRLPNHRFHLTRRSSPRRRLD